MKKENIEISGKPAEKSNDDYLSYKDKQKRKIEINPKNPTDFEEMKKEVNFVKEKKIATSEPAQRKIGLINSKTKSHSASSGTKGSSYSKGKELPSINKGSANNKGQGNKKGVLSPKKREEGNNAKKQAEKIIVFDSFESLISQVKTQDMSDILKYLKEFNYAFIQKKILNRTIPARQSIADFLKNAVLEFLKEEYEVLKNKNSDLRKKGMDVREVSLKLMSIPLKIKIFGSTFTKKDFDNIIVFMKQIEDILKSIQEELNARIEKKKSDEENIAAEDAKKVEETKTTEDAKKVEETKTTEESKNIHKRIIKKTVSKKPKAVKRIKQKSKAKKV